jgi:DNA-binding response OmpR family regulator
VSGKSTASDRFWAEQQGANGYIVKPFAPVDLLREVRRFA